MSVDKSIDYVNQDGYKNYTKNSDSVTVPRKFKARKNAPSTKLAYITDAEEKQLKKQNPGTPHKGPSNVPSYDSFDAQGDYTSGTAMSAAETGSRNERDRAEVRASNIGGPKGLAPGATSQEAQDLRAATIAAGAGQRVNPGFFDSRDTVSRAELAAAKAINPDAFRAARSGGLGSFFTGGGFLGNIIRAIANRFGLGKRYNEPTYDMSEFSKLGLGGVDPTVNPTFQNDLGNEGLLKLIKDEDRIKRFTDMDLSFLKNNPDLQALYERDKTVSLMNNFIPAPGQTDYFPSQVGGITNTKVEPPDFMFASPQFQEGLDNSMYGADRMLFGADGNQKYYYGDVLPDGTVFESDADGITNYDFDTPVGPELKKDEGGILDLKIPGLTVSDKLL